MLWYENLWKLLSEERIQTIALSSLLNHGEIPSTELVLGLRDIKDTVAALGMTPVFISDTPWPPQNIPICLSANTTDIQRCVLERTTSVPADVSAISKEAFDDKYSVFIDTEDWFCVQSVCPVVVGNVVAYRDSSHITSRYAELLGPLLYLYIARAIELSD
ncbi:MAG: hypothetical protein EBY88_02815 [Actinobacteria bacterium]|nr:hypothetical protein [Actinomycetota bacterium]